MKTRRNLSGIYMRHQDKSGKWGNICFEDMSETEIDDLILNMNDKYKDNMIKALVRAINDIGEQLDLIKE